MNKNIKFVLIIVMPFIIGITLVSKILIEAEYLEINNITDSLMQRANELIKIENFDSSKSLLTLITLQETSFGRECILYDSAVKITWSIDKYIKWQKDERYKDVLINISESDYDELLNNNFYKSYIFHPYLDSLFIQTLYENRKERSYLLRHHEAEKKATRKVKWEKVWQEKLKAEADVRKVYGEKLRNSFLDEGLDIKVKVTGVNNTRLILTYVLFDDVWMRKMQTSGNFNEWHKIGFNRIDLKNGYDYNSYYYWD